MYNTIADFDPLHIVSHDRIRKSLNHGLPDALRGEIWCMLCRCSREKAAHGKGLYQKLLDETGANPADVHRIKKDIPRTFTNYPENLKEL